MRGQAARVLRGGSWNNNAINLRASNRNRNEPDNRNNNIGFRPARTLHRRGPAVETPGVCRRESSPAPVFAVTQTKEQPAVGGW